MAYRHARGYDEHPDCVSVACADIVEENARAFADRNGIDDANVFTDHERMLEVVNPDVVSVCTPVPTHADIVVDCTEGGETLQAIHCEKPMAATPGDSRRMKTVCDENGVQLTFNHQRRVATPSQRVADIVEAGRIGDPTRLELTTKNVFDSGTHLIDLCNLVLGDPAVEWVIGQIDYRTENVRYGHHNENEAFVRWRYRNGVDAVAATGNDADFIDCSLRVLGTGGEVELNPDGDAQICLKLGPTDPWEELDTGEPLADIPAAIVDVIEGLETDSEPALSADRALAALEISFAAYESSRRRGRVDFPLEIDDNPLLSMVENGDLTPRPVDRDDE
ncbi:Gfo/Idh/MocA family protein [Natronosalvus rutilus]|uniref:Gfo/Idh/MocA family oxidoreductase n=1 Tax=Natronosalvus rutilus TaxID=2953753 RepID=A0A9E7N8Q9_9EURY|nr:Gfo/Idh/MocA family oxidoreductase [Natronosalvus rutilus]UTF52463.1 Gfo/Idh/MocA family oxidoreductase [Natronosalvus rutilus]